MAVYAKIRWMVLIVVCFVVFNGLVLPFMLNIEYTPVNVIGVIIAVMFDIECIKRAIGIMKQKENEKK